MKSVPLLLLLLCVSAVVGISKRSARWDAHLDHLRSKRQFPSGCNFQSVQQPGGCTLQGVMDNDVLGRRASGLLATPESQGRCGSCWAFASTHVYTDTRSIMANSVTPPLGPQHPASCFQDPRHVVSGNGCCGGSLVAGFLFFETTGAVTATCAPYHDDLRRYSDIRRMFRNKPSISHTCPATCADGTVFNPAALRLRGIRGLRTEAEVIDALADRAVFIAIRVSTSFKDYKCGVFCEAQSFRSEGGHAMEIVDYGTENGVDFWVVKNSWGTNRGEGGYFRMRRSDSNIIGYLAPVLSPNEQVVSVEDMPSDIVNSFTCAATEVENPTDDELVMSAVEHTIDQINEMSSIPCPDGRAATAVVLRSVTDANTQVVDGIVVELDLQVDVQGCEDDEQRARVTSTVMLQANNTFGAAVFDHTFVTGGGPPSGGGGGRNSAVAVTSSFAMILFATITILLLANYK